MRHKVKVPPCQYCNKSFLRTEHLRRHERTHTKEKPHACICGRSFSRQDLLSRHVKLAKEPEGHGALSPSVSNRQRKSVDSSEIPMPNFGSTDELRSGTGPGTASALSACDTQASPSEAANLNPAALTNELDMLWDSFQLQHNPFELSIFSPEFPMNFQTFDLAPSLDIPWLPETATPASDVSNRAEETIWQDDLPCASEVLRHQPLKDASTTPRPRPRF